MDAGEFVVEMLELLDQMCSLLEVALITDEMLSSPSESNGLVHSITRKFCERPLRSK